MSVGGPEQGSTYRLGPDRVMLRADRMVVETPVEIDGWEVRTYRQIVIRHAGRSWRIARCLPGRSEGFRYELEPWMPGPSELPGQEFDYDLELVTERERTRAARARAKSVGLALGPVLPLVGFLGAATKRRIEERWGIDAVTATRASIYLELAVLIVSGTLLSIGTMVAGIGGVTLWPLRPLLVAALIVLLDALFRYDSLIREERYPPGFYQWVLARWRGAGRGGR